MLPKLFHIFVFLLSLVTYGCSEHPTRYDLSGQTMGTVWNVVIETNEEIDKESIQQRIEERLAAINSVFSTWQDDSEISLLNESSSLDTELSNEFGALLRVALTWNKKTDGLFDITVKDLVNAYGFSQQEVSVLPTKAELTDLLGKTGSDKLQYDDKSRKLSRTVSGMQLDFSAIAKGYAVKEVSALLLKANYPIHLVEVGGEVQAGEKKLNGGDWVVAVEKVSEDFTRKVQQPIRLTNTSIATSGDYRNYREIDGVRVSHIINPITGLPAQHKLASVSVIHDSCTIADILATAIFVMGESKGYEFADRMGIPVYMIVRAEDGFITRHNELMKPYLTQKD